MVSPAPLLRPVRRTAAISAHVVAARPDESPDELAARAETQLAALGLQPLLAFWFGRTAALGSLPETGGCPALRVEGRPCHAGPMVGVQFYTAPLERTVRRIQRGSRVVGAEYDDGSLRHVLLAGVEPEDRAAAPATQAMSVFAQVEKLLEGAGCSYADVARTWFFNRRILDWYDTFNRVRSAFYGNVAFRSGATPASTGIEGSPASGAALAFAAWAVQPNSTRAIIQPVASPLQCPAPEYGSAFSRAMEIAGAPGRRLFVSGTASIAPNGRSLWPGDIDRQIATSLDVIESILRTRGNRLADADRAFAYFKRPADLARFEDWLLARDLAALPFLPMHCDVCRDDLLFELELDAAR